MKELTTADVLEITGLTAKAFRLWCEQGVVIPVEGGKGHGNHRRFSLMQTIGISVAAQLRRSARGCGLEYAGKVVAAFGSMSEAELLERFKADGPCFVTEHGGLPILRGANFPDWVNVQEVYQHTMEMSSKIENLPRPNIQGRRRGLQGGVETIKTG